MPNTLLKNPVSVNVNSTAVGLAVAGTAAASTSGNGAKPSNVVTIDGTAGQETTGSGKAAGDGADVRIAAGAGGLAASGSLNGAGGSVTINPGVAGTGPGTAGSPGKLLLATLGGNVGIGTTTPTELLQISKGGNVALHVTNSDNGSTSFLQSAVQNGAPVTRVGNIGSPAGDIRFSPGNSDSITIRANGSFGIGTTTPTAPLDVRVGGGLASPYFIGRLTNTSTGNGPQSGLLLSAPNSSNSGDRNWASNINVNAHGDYALFHSSTASSDPIVANTRLEILSNGNIGIGTTGPGSKLHVVGGMQLGAPTGGDKGTGSINISGDVYKNGVAQLNKLDGAQRQIEKLIKRVERLEAQLARKTAKASATSKAVKSKKPAKSRKERR